MNIDAMVSAITMELVNPKDLNAKDWRDIHEVTQDMWAYGLGEFVKCESCNRIYSKKDVYGYLPRERILNPVGQIIREEGIENKRSICCEATYIILYGSDFINTLIHKLTQYVYGILIIAKSNNKIVGYMDAYIADFESIYDEDISCHYGKIPSKEIKDKVESLLDMPINNMIFFSEAGFIQSYSSMVYFYNFYRYVYQGFMEQYKGLPGMTELDIRNKVLYKVYQAMGPKFVHFDKSLISSHHPDYESILACFKTPIHTFGQKFDMPMKDFYRKFLK